MEDMLSEAVKWAVPAALGAIAALVGGLWRQNRAVREGLRSLLRCEIVKAHKEYVVRGDPMSLEDLEYVGKTYEAYHALGGNGTGTRLWKDIEATEIREA